ncbi:uncharacterized protein LOC100215503 isoform X1 [Hydra vulgaris]|uniref:uncharacterized protein LOC100215503 isoform X1 n=1 Tax=Hydra vulgaris TaxID=6087 RepID=UPI0032EA6B0E
MRMAQRYNDGQLRKYFKMLLRSFDKLSYCGNCTDGWLENGNYCYLFHSITATLQGQSWYDSLLSCQRYGGNLLSVADNTENTFISDQFKDTTIKNQHYWIGLNDIQKEGIFVWSDNSTSKFRFWNYRSGEPNNWNNNEDCVEATYDGRWNDNSCDRLFGFICKVKIGVTTLAPPTLPPFPNNTDKPSTCEAGWKPWGTSCYEIVNDSPKSWSDARSDCLRRFGDLLIIDSKDEQSFITNLISSSDGSYWIGLSDSYKEGEFFWVNRDKLNNTISFWRANEPSNSFGNEDCVEMISQDSGLWNDNHCTTLFNYICEKVSGVHNCPDGWIVYGNNCYQINAHPNQKVTYAEAEKECHSFNQLWGKNIDVTKAELTSILSTDEQTMLVKEFRKLGTFGFGNNFWIGLNSISNNGQFHWSDSSVLNFMNFESLSYNDTMNKCVSSSLADGFWKVSSCDVLNYFVCKVQRGKDRCYDPMGMQGFQIPNSAITASGQLSSTTPPGAGRLYLKNGNSLDGAWCARNETNQWLQIDFGQSEKLTYLAFQGKANSDAYIKGFYLKYSMDGVTWDIFGDNPPTLYHPFTALGKRSDYETVFSNPFPTQLLTRFIRIYPFDWDVAPCMRVEFYGCSQDVNSNACGLGWKMDVKSRSCYKIINQKTTWDSANSICFNEGGQLLSITNPDEMLYINSELKALSGKSDFFWIGMNDLDSKGIYRWSDQSPTFLVNWYSGNPKIGTLKERCVLVRSVDGFWMNEDCSSFNSFICKKKYENPYEVKQPFNSNWRSSCDYYWPLDSVTKNNEVFGTTTAQYFGSIQPTPYSTFPVTLSNNQYRNVLSFNGNNNYLKTDIDSTCSINPISDNCPHGFSASVLFKYKENQLSSSNRFIIDSVTTFSVGYSIYINIGMVYVDVVGSNKHYLSGSYYNKDSWNHLAFTYSSQNGLVVYINGELRNSQRSALNNLGIKSSSSKTLYFAKSAANDVFSEVELSSFAVFERELSLSEIKQIYIAEFGRCGWGQEEVGTNCYSIELTETDWLTASKQCQMGNGSLISINNPIEQAFVSLKASSNMFPSGMWIGLNSKEINHVYNWTDGSQLSFTFWNTMEPNNWNGRREDCVHTTVKGHWNDDLCYFKKPFICKYSRKIIQKVENQDDFVVSFASFQSLTFGCPLMKRVVIKSVYYGNNGCFLSQNDTVPIVKSVCNGPRCANVIANNFFFKKNVVCNSYFNKMNITYTCEEDIGSVNPMGCPSGYTVYNDNRVCYRLYTYQANLTEALTQCKNDSSTGNLVSIHSREEELFLTTMLGALYKNSDVWLGMRYDRAEQVYSWMNNNTVNYTNWYNKQPDPSQGEYIKFSLYNGADDFLFWQAAKPEEKLPFVCRTLKAGTTEAPPPVTAKSGQKCDNGSIEYGDYCYFLNTNMLSFYDAEEACSKMGENGHLASVPSFEVNNLLFNASVYNNIDFTWFGLTNEGIINGYIWLDGSPLSFINWYTNVPYRGVKHLCAGMQNGGKWQDLQCYLKQASFCQVPKRKMSQTTTTVLPITSSQDPSSCPSGWKLYNTNCYYFSNYSYLDWHKSKLACESANSSLTSILNLDENNFIASEIRRRYMANPYIGLNDLFHESGWKWVDGSVSNYFNFDTNQPDDWYGMEDCVELRSTGFWNDVSCNIKKPYVCKKSNNTTPVQIVPSISPTAQPDSGYCENDWTLYGSKCYFIKYGPGNRLQFKDAEELCRSMNATLTSVHSEFEHSFLLSQLYDAHESVYIGLSDQQIERTFLWNDQSSVDYTNWYYNQPDSFGKEDCVEMMPFFKEQGGWNDIHCEKENGYICSKKSLPSQPTNSTTTVSPKISCPEGYKLYQTSCYKYVASPMSWDGAWNECKKVDSSDLVSVHSPFEQGFLTSFYGERSAQFWIGLHKRIGEDQLHWTDNSHLDFYNWQNFQQPFVPKNEERCIIHQYKANQKGTWTNQNCLGLFPFVCKITNEESKGKPEFKGNCSIGWTKYNNLCYKLFSDYSDRASWPEARERCSIYGGNLATIPSDDIQKQLRSMVRNSYTSVWIGLNDQAEEHSFKWSNGEIIFPSSYTNWAQGEPNDVEGTENCVEISTSSGQWNDNQCSSQQSFLCEHTLECIDDLGMVSQGIPDSNINATSYVNGSLPYFARLNYKHNNKDAAWCTDIKDGKQSITINLGEYMTVTRINIQGLLNSGYVILYQLEYSLDGVSWNVYLDKDSADSKLIPANSNGNNIDGHKVMIETLFVRITPKKFYGNLICMRLEFFGCKSVCSKALGMQNNLIKNEDLSASSAHENFPVTQARPFYADGWCAQTANENQWYQIDLRTPHKVTRVMATGQGTLKYELAFSNDGTTWSNYTTLKGLTKLFSIEHKIYELETEQISRYVRFLPKEWDQKICLQVELFGCTIECNKSLGMENKVIPDKALSASSSQTGYPPQNARLNLGAYNSNGWCAQKNDIYQYLQISFDHEVRVAYISTQGSEGDVSKYVTKYRLQWSTNGDFWNHLPNELPGNNDGRNFNRFKLPYPILARYIRINPIEFVKSICMRVELYGCPLDSQIKPTEPPPKTKDISVSGNFRLTSYEYNDGLSSSSRTEFAKLASIVEEAITRVYIGSETFKDGFKRVIVTGFRPGSVIVDFQLLFSTSSNVDPIKPLKDQIATGELSGLKVDKTSFKINEPPKDKRSSSSGGLSKGGKIALGVFFSLLIIMIGIAIVYMRKKKSGFEHKIFDNPNFDQQKYLKTKNDLSDYFITHIVVYPKSYGGNCYDGWIENKDFCYLFNNVNETTPGQTWDDSLSICKQFGGSLLSVENEAENLFLLKYIKNNLDKPFMNRQRYWIGLSDKKIEGKFVWSDNTISNFTYWGPNQPSMSLSRHSEDCVVAVSDGSWYDYSCRSLFGFICKAKKGAATLVPPTLSPNFTFPNSTDKPITCEAGWIPWGTSCYGIITGLPKTWSDARADCLRRFGDLVIVETYNEHNFLANRISRTDVTGYWIGLSDSFKEKEFFWVNKEKLDQSISFWSYNEPSNSYGNEDCVEMIGKNSGLWNDNHCLSMRNYICEKVSGVHNCPEGWVVYSENCYQINAHPNQKMTYADAEKECHSFNHPWKNSNDVAKAELTSILSKDEQAMLVGEFIKLGLSSWGEYFWIGLNISSNGQFAWSDFSKFDYTNYDSTFLNLATTDKCVSSSLASSIGKWKASFCNDLNNFVCKVKRGKDRCYDPLGMQGFQIPNSAITASDQFSSKTPPEAARLYLKNNNLFDGAWCGKNKTSPWLQIDFGDLKQLTYMSVQGQANSYAIVTEFYLKYSYDGVSWSTYGDLPPLPYYKFPPNQKISNWQPGLDNAFSFLFQQPLKTRYIRVYPLNWIALPCLRVEFYGCSQDSSSLACGIGWKNDVKSNNCYKISNQKTTWDSANSACLGEGGELLSIVSPDELLYVKKMLQSLSGKSDFYWVGLNDLDSKGIYKWSDQSPTPLVNWYSSYPKNGNLKAKCVLIRSADGFWVNEDCYSYNAFICKRKYKNPYEFKQSFNSNWRSSSDYYWPLDLVMGKEVMGTSTAEYFGSGQPNSLSLFPVTLSNQQPRYVLSFNGKDNYVKAVINSSCSINPLSNTCLHGFSASVLFKCSQESSTKCSIIDSVAYNKFKGYSIYVIGKTLFVYVLGENIYYSQNVKFIKDTWYHVAFTYSLQNGLFVYINGTIKATQPFFRVSYSRPQSTETLYFGASASLEFCKVELSSVAIFERELSVSEINQIYLSEFGRCSWGQEEVGTYCYAINFNEMSWSLARDACLSSNGSLASINNPIEQAFISLKVSESKLLNEFWIGLASKEINNFYNWIDGSPLSFTFWDTMEPNNYEGRREDCVHTTVNGRWNDNICYIKRPFVCKYTKKIQQENEGQQVEYNVNFWYYQSQTFGCPLTKRVIIKSVFYGNENNGCFLPQNETVPFIQSLCSGSLCANIKANDEFFKKKNFCRGVSKKLNVTYTCEEDINSPNSKGCPSSYTVNKNNNICYRLYTYKASLTEALKQCQADSKNGNLVSIHSREEELFLTTMLGALYVKTDIWLGMKYNPLQQMYTWMNNNTVNYTNWYNKQPDPRQGEYIKLSLYNGADDFLFWQAAIQEEKLSFICRALKEGATEPQLVTTPGSTTTCQQEWISFGDNCYFLNNNLLSFHDAEEACQNMGVNGHLASVSSFELNDKLFGALEKSNLTFAWFGLINEGITNGYTWLDGSPLSFVNWYTDSPSLGVFHVCAGLNLGGKWLDQQCYLSKASFCQVPKGKIFSTTAAPPATPDQDPLICLPGWKLFEKNCYFFSKGLNVDWHKANLACQSNSSNLTSVLNMNENKFIASEIKRRGMQDPYIGLNDMFHESGFQWVDGSAPIFFNFDVSQPDDWHGMEDCVEFRSSGFWNDVSCNLLKPYICKKSNNSAPTHIAPSDSPTAKPDIGFCEDEWSLYGSKCYLFKYGIGNRLNFQDAENFCKSVNATLTSIHSEFENSFLLSKLYDAHEPLYIGMSDRQYERTFIWNDQTSVDYTNWYIAQPSWYGDEDCVEIMPYFVQQGRWNDINCKKENGFICSKNSLTSLPATTLTPTPTAKCPEGFQLYQMSCYKFVALPLTWVDAWDECKKVDNSDLVSVHSPFEQGYLTSIFGEKAAQFWIGLHKHIGEDQLHWTDNSPFDFKYFQGYVSYVPKGEERCFSHQYKIESRNSYYKGTWKNEKCDIKLPFVCKITNKESEGISQFKGNCSVGWTKYLDLCYKVFSDYSDRVTWTEARERCNTYGGNLAYIPSEDIQTQLRIMVRESWTNVWIGLNDQAEEHNFKWNNNEFLSPGSYTNWAQQEPSDVSGTENCVEMSSANGQWNDNLCSSRLGFLCEHTLECVDDLGMVSQSIPDSSISATSYANGSIPSFARLNYKHNDKDVAWCTDIKDGKQSITINLGEYMTITRISTQGLINSGYVLVYQLEYSLDGVSWKIYPDEDNIGSKLIPANSNGLNVDGYKVMIQTLYIRITPKRFSGDLICLRLELYGCRSVCSKALGMKSNLIKDEDLSASSAMDDHPVTNARPFSSNGWCAKMADGNQWYQIDLRTPHKVTKVMAIGKGTLKYLLAFSVDGTNWNNYKTLKGLDKLFDYNIHQLENEQITRFVRFLPKKFDEQICLQVELFGCTIECDTSLGMENKIIPDKALSASSAQVGYPPKNARLNLGDYKSNGWCAKKNDINQYLEVSFDKEVRITSIATQGSDGDVSKYVTKYRLQWSLNRDFWNHFGDEISGNNNGRTVNQFKLPNSIIARYIRINPISYVNAICMRIELYGCVLDSPTDTPLNTNEHLIFGSFRLVDIEYTNDLSSSNSLKFTKLANSIQVAITQVYIGSETFKYGFKGVAINSFRSGSVIVDFKMFFSTSSNNDPMEPLKKEIETGQLGDWTVDKNSFKINQESKKDSHTGSNSGLSSGGKVGLVIFFLILISAVIGLALYIKRKKSGYKHKPFSNPLFEEDMNVKFMNGEDS